MSVLHIVRNKRGVGLLDAMVTLLILSVVAMFFGATYPSGVRCARQAQEYKTAAAIAQRKMELVRLMAYQSLTQPLLSIKVIDTDSMTSPYSFTSRDAVANELHQGTGTLTVTDLPGGIRRVRVTVSWQGTYPEVARSIVLTTLVADKRPQGG